MKPDIIGYIKQLVVNLDYLPNYGKQVSHNVWETIIDVVISSLNDELLSSAFDVLQKHKMKCFYLYSPYYRSIHWHYRLKYSKLITQEQLCNLVFDDLTYMFDLIYQKKPFNCTELNISLKMFNEPKQLPKRWDINFNFTEKDFMQIFKQDNIKLKPLFICFPFNAEQTELAEHLKKELTSRKKDYYELTPVKGKTTICWKHKGLIYSRPELIVAQRFIEIDIDQLLRDYEFKYCVELKDFKVIVKRQPHLVRVV